MSVKYISVAILDKSLKDFSRYLQKNHYNNCVLGLTLSFGNFSCEVRINSKEIENVKK